MLSSKGNTFTLPCTSYQLQSSDTLNETDKSVSKRFDPAIRPGTIGAARLVRQYAQLSQSGDVVDVEAFDPNSLGSNVYLASMDLEVRKNPCFVFTVLRN